MLFYIIFFLTSCLYALFSFILTEPNLVMSSHPLYWNFQTYMWEHFYANSQFVTAFYIFIIIALFCSYLLIVYSLAQKKIEFTLSLKSKYLWLFLLVLVPILISYNALSHDVFNYMFYAKMLLVHHANPYVFTPQDFEKTDLWVRFMHNVDVINVYGYAWTGLSLVPFVLGFQKFLLTLIAFKVFTVFGVFLLYQALQHLSRSIYNRNLYVHELALVFLNPLFLLEAVSNYHNDLWMMIPAVFSVSMLIRLFNNTWSNTTKVSKPVYFGLSSGLLFISIFIKLATVVLVPFYIFAALFLFFLPQYSALIQKRFHIPVPVILISAGLQFISRLVEKYIPTIVALTLFATLFSERSRQFLPWYLLWIIVWVPFIQNKTIRNLFLVFSLSCLLRYVPWLENAYEYSPEIILRQKVVTWGIPALYLLTRLKDTVFSMKKFGRP